MVRALVSHRCGPGSIPGPGVTCGLSLLLVLVPAPRVFLLSPPQRLKGFFSGGVDPLSKVSAGT